MFASNPDGGPGYDATDVKNGGNGYVPISLQYEPYTAINERAYDFGYGMNWKGIIKDARTSKYISIPKPVISANGTLVTIANLSQTKVYYSIDNSSPAFIENNLYSKPFTVKQAG